MPARTAQYALVSALSLTYVLQSRYKQTNRGTKDRLTSPQILNDAPFELVIYNSLQYLKDVTGMEAEHAVDYAEASGIIELNWKRVNGEKP